jgi:hypothetical protein
MSAAFCSTPISCALHQTKSHGRSATHFPLARALPDKAKIGPNIVNTQIHNPFYKRLRLDPAAKAG